MDWFPQSDETLVYRGPVAFASGLAAKVSGMRWFRDEDGRDIAGELPGWPQGPVHVPRGDAAARTSKTLGGLGKGVVVLAAIAVNAVSNANPDVPVGTHGRSTDRAHEIDDFPVLVAAPGTTARTLPYQLDPDRREARRAVELAVTDRRVLVLGGGEDGGLAPAEELWEVPRAALGDVVLHGHGAGDLTLVFADGSRARLRLAEASEALKVVYELCPAKRVELTELAVKKLKFRAEPTKLPHTWAAVRRDDGEVVARRIIELGGKPSWQTWEYRVTKWVDSPAAGG